MSRLARLDHRYIWHPFTQMRDWLEQEPIVIVEGEGALLRDSKGREYLDANSSIWTNLHGHRHPRIDAAIRGQLDRIAHSSALGLANEPASLLAEQLVLAANRPAPKSARTPGRISRPRLKEPPILSKVFYSDDGSTAMEVALKLAHEFARRTNRSARPRFLSLHNAYHGDTIGAVSLGHIDLFHKAYSPLLFRTDKVMAPYCYRCRFNRAKPERGDAREYRSCNWECLERLESAFEKQRKKKSSYAGFVFEPLIQGAAGMIAQPRSWLRRATTLARDYGALLIADEVMTGFGRTGTFVDSASETSPAPRQATARLFACQKENVRPDFLAVAKGLTGGYLPMAATLTTAKVFDAFLGDYAEFKTFFHGHSYTANQLGAAASLASLGLLNGKQSIRGRARLEKALAEELRVLWQNPHVGDIRQEGLVAGVELVRDWRRRTEFPLSAQAGRRVCQRMARLGVLTRPIGNVIVLMPPYCTTPGQVRRMVSTLKRAVKEEFGG